MQCYRRRWLCHRDFAFQYRKRYGLHAICCWVVSIRNFKRFNTASGMDCMQSASNSGLITMMFRFNTASGMDCMQFAYMLFALSNLMLFQYRKRYGLHAMRRRGRQLCPAEEFQYRKRYGLHAISTCESLGIEIKRFNTASGMDCMQ